MNLRECTIGTMVVSKDHPREIGHIVGLFSNTLHEIVPIIQWSTDDISLRESSLLADRVPVHTDKLMVFDAFAENEYKKTFLCIDPRDLTPGYICED